ncbi:MAG TPA: hypothetical protein VGD58_09645 [Herpetosiphonaceae bacterium]
MKLSISAGSAWGAVFVRLALIVQVSMFVLIQEIQAGLAASMNCQKVLTGEQRTAEQRTKGKNGERRT